MGIFKRTTKRNGNKREYWYIDYVVKGKRKWESVGKVGQVTKADARKLLAVRKTEVLQGKFNNPKKTVMPTFTEFAEEYIEYAKENKKSWDRDERSLKFLLPHFGRYFLDDISPILIEKYKLNRKSDVSARTVNIELALLKSMFNLAIKWDRCQTNPVRMVNFYKEEPFKINVLREDEEHKLLEASSDHLKPILITALNTGMRYSEITNLCWRDVNLEEEYIHITKSKSGKSRQIPINNKLKDTLKGLILTSSVSKSVGTKYLKEQKSQQLPGGGIGRRKGLKIPR
ncbi:MAG: tyrosine-type recombinase/integrase, partial [Candidatus Dadabacteria bacterium]|nr:tyrosine-type recombinase/integrase [Candidatus Dadabacteria bacterium]NIQ17183.1 tyrosine-type recombinase/integrase [Candidatus Dadabacteria bacterium]